MFGRIGEKHPMFGKSKPQGSGKLSKKIEVTDIVNNTTSIYDSISAAALGLNIRQTTISTYISKNQKKPYKDRYVFKLNSSL